MSEIDEEELQLDYEDACNEAAELEQDLRAERLQVQELRLRLMAVGIKEAADLSAAESKVTAIDNMVEREQQIQDVCDMLRWIADFVDLGESVVLTVGCEVPLGYRRVQFEEVVQWPLLKAPRENLKVTVPTELKDEVVELMRLAKVRSDKGLEDLRGRVAEMWEVVPGELSLGSLYEPAVLLAHRPTSSGILVATWPTAEALEDFKLVYAPAGHVPSVGDRVEILYQDEWYLGSLYAMDASINEASVQCDVDGPDVITIVPLNHVRHFITPTSSGYAPEKQLAYDGVCSSSGVCQSGE